MANLVRPITLTVPSGRTLDLCNDLGLQIQPPGIVSKWIDRRWAKILRKSRLTGGKLQLIPEVINSPEEAYRAMHCNTRHEPTALALRVYEDTGMPLPGPRRNYWNTLDYK